MLAGDTRNALTHISARQVAELEGWGTRLCRDLGFGLNQTLISVLNF